MEDNALRNRVKKFLEFSQITQKDFAVMAKVTPAYVTNIKKNITEPVLKVLKEINPALSLDWLILGVGPMLSDVEQLKADHAAELAKTRDKYEKYIADLKESNNDLREKVALYQRIVKLEAELKTGKK
ncbi:MAG: helix-turn-helix domain-containing protein [Lachnospiraceae bacterium]|nr:helix-turn-helix domain-containing protein [Lachnospiraceae bacterium]